VNTLEQKIKTPIRIKEVSKMNKDKVNKNIDNNDHQNDDKKSENRLNSKIEELQDIILELAKGLSKGDRQSIFEKIYKNSSENNEITQNDLSPDRDGEDSPLIPTGERDFSSSSSSSSSVPIGTTGVKGLKGNREIVDSENENLSNKKEIQLSPDRDYMNLQSIIKRKFPKLKFSQHKKSISTYKQDYSHYKQGSFFEDYWDLVKLFDSQQPMSVTDFRIAVKTYLTHLKLGVKFVATFLRKLYEWEYVNFKLMETNGLRDAHVYYNPLYPEIDRILKRKEKYYEAIRNGSHSKEERPKETPRKGFIRELKCKGSLINGHCSDKNTCKLHECTPKECFCKIVSANK